MADETISPNMKLPIPNVAITSGYQSAVDFVQCFNQVDSHSHIPGQGVLITPDAIDITRDLEFNEYSATTLKKVSFVSQASALSGTGFLSNVGGNLYYNDGSGNQVQITSGGGVVGSPGGFTGLASPAAATYVSGSKLFLWTAASGKAAAMDNGSVTIRETNVSAAPGITLSSPSALASDYQLTLPAALPASNQYLLSSSLGNLSFSTADGIAAAFTNVGTGSIVSTATAANANTLLQKVTTSNSTASDAIAAAMTSSGSNAISVVRTRTTTTNGTDPGAGGISISSSSATFTTTSTSFVSVTNLSTILTTSGRPVSLSLIPTPSAGVLTGYLAQSGSDVIDVEFLRGATVLFTTTISSGTFNVPPGMFSGLDAVAAGTYTYSVKVKTLIGNTASVNNVRLMAYEL